MKMLAWLRPLAPALLLTLPALAAAQNPAPKFEPRELAEHAWQDESYGVAVNPPIGTKLVEQTGDGYLVHIVDEAKEFQITIAMKESRADLTLEKVAVNAQQQIKSQQPTSDLVGREMKKVGTLDGAVMYFRVPQMGRGDALVGQAIAQLTPRRFIAIELRCGIDTGPKHIPTFEAMIQTLNVTDMLKLAKERGEAIKRGSAWRQSITTKQLHDALVTEQYFRITEDGRDIGYMRVRQDVAANGIQSTQEPGVAVEVRSHIISPGVTIDSAASMYLSDSDVVEIWTIATTYKRTDARGQLERRTFTEAGARSGDEIDVTTTDSTVTRPQLPVHFKRPPEGYLSKFEAQLVGQLLPRNRAGTYGFYWYESSTKKLVFRSEQVTPTLNGYTVITRLSPNAPPLRATYDSRGRMLSKQLGSNRELVASTSEVILRRWQNR